MKTLHFPENYDLCRPSSVVGCENSNNNSNSIANTHGHSSKTVKSSSRVVTYGNNSIEQSTKFEKNANEFQLKQQQQEQNKKRKRDTGEYFHHSYENFLFYSSSFPPSSFLASFTCPLFHILTSFFIVPTAVYALLKKYKTTHSYINLYIFFKTILLPKIIYT